jgi:hypothetical protein
VMNREITSDKTGRRMKILNIESGFYQTVMQSAAKHLA